MFPDTWPDWVPWIIGAGAIATALLAITALAVKTGRGVKTAAKWLGDVLEERMIQTLEKQVPGLTRKDVEEIVTAKIAPIHAEVRPNGGSSMNDKITRIDRAVIHLASWATRHDPEGFTDHHPRQHGGGSSVEGPDDARQA